LASAADKSFGLDFSSTGKQDHIVLYRPGAGAIFILNPARQAVVGVIDPGQSVGGYFEPILMHYYQVPDSVDLIFRAPLIWHLLLTSV
jgi:hypothetical protein